MLLAGGAAVLAIIVFLLLIEPAYKGIGRLERSLPQQRAGAAELESLISEVKSLRSRPQVASVSAGDVRCGGRYVTRPRRHQGRARGATVRRRLAAHVFRCSVQ